MPKREPSTRKVEAQGSSAASSSFEAQLALLERIVRELERGDLPLERSLELFEQGVRLSRQCQERLSEAERRIEVLLQDDAGRPVIAGAFESDEFHTGTEEEEEEDDESVF
jgi:exodeoxyribonuclease VII small subunit